jgi:hypothetical protein
VEGFILLLSIFAMIAVPLSLCATVQYCVHVGKDLSFAKLILFSWSLAIIFIPFSFLASASILLNFADNRIESSTLLTVDLGYIIFGWLVCSALYGKLIVPNFSNRKLNLP